jgi:phage gpG-like protein
MITGRITGDREVLTKFSHMPGGLQDKLANTITKLCIKLRVHVVQDKLTGQVLNVRTGRLRRSITYDVTTPGASSVQGTVGTNVAYGRFFELGFQGTENVREHLRMVKEAFGKPIKDPRQVTVREHSRHVNMPAHSFLGSALADMRPEILTQIDQAVKDAIK